MDVVETPIDKLVPYARNPRRNEDAIATVAASLAEFGWRQPIIVDEDKVIVVGHTRYEAAKRLGMTSVPVHVAHGLTPAQLRAYRLMDNRSHQNASWDDELLKFELADLKLDEFDLALTGFEDDELARLLAETPAEGLVDEDEIPEPPARPVTRRGDLWLLGDHRLLCGDSTSAEDVTWLMNGEHAALFATDPPYLVDYDGTNYPTKKNASARAKKITNKDRSEEHIEQKHWDDSSQGPEFYEAFMQVAIDCAIKEDAAWYCWHASRRQAMLEACWSKFEVLHHQQIIWAKSRPVLTRLIMLWAHEPCLFGWRWTVTTLPEAASRRTVEAGGRRIAAPAATDWPSRRSGTRPVTEMMTSSPSARAAVVIRPIPAAIRISARLTMKPPIRTDGATAAAEV